jgi:uncharacterized protein (DUF302 family)
MLQAKAVHKLEDLEPVLRRAAQSHGAAVLTCAHLGQLMREHGVETSQDATIFAVCHAELYAALLAADIRFSAFLPCRIAAYREGESLTLQAVSPREFCRVLNRPDQEEVAASLERLLSQVMQDASQPFTAAAQVSPASRCWGLGATEEQMSLRGSLPQRIDKHGSKIEDLAGTGEHDSPGG